MSLTTDEETIDVIENEDGTYGHPDEGDWLTMEAWALAQTWAGEKGISVRSVKRWIADDEIDPKPKQVGAKKQWFVLRTAKRVSLEERDKRRLAKEATAEEAGVQSTGIELRPIVVPPAIPITIDEDEANELEVFDAEFEEYIWKLDLREYLDRMPANIPVRLGALLLGLGIGYVEARPEEFGIMPYAGPHRSHVMPKKIIYERAGLL